MPRSLDVPFKLFKCCTPTFSLAAALQHVVETEGDEDFDFQDMDDDSNGNADDDYPNATEGRPYNSEDHGGDQGHAATKERQPRKRKRRGGDVADLSHPAIKVSYSSPIQLPFKAPSTANGSSEANPGTGSSKRGSGRKAHNKTHKKLQRRAKNSKAFKDNTAKLSTSKGAAFLGAATVVPVSLALGDLPANSSGYEATYEESRDERTLSLPELLAEGFDLIEWDGR